MEAHVRTTRKHAFVLRQDDLQKIWKLLENRIGTVDASAECSDDMERVFDTWEELASYDNPPRKKITKLSVESHSDDREKYADVSFSAQESEGIRIWIRASEQLGSEIKDKISDILDGTKPWYSFLARENSLLFLILTVVVVFLSRLLETLETLAVKILVTIPLGIIMGLIARRLVEPWFWLFPVGYFALGQGEHRYEIGEKVRWGIVIAFVVSFAASMASLIW